MKNLGRNLIKIGFGLIILPYNTLAGAILMYIGASNILDEKEKGYYGRHVYTDSMRNNVNREMDNRYPKDTDVIDCYYRR